MIHLGVFACFLSVVGCGGGGATSPIGGGGVTSSQVQLYATDDISTTYDHIWVTIKKIVLNSAAGPVTVYDNPTGQQLDLTQLHDSSGSIFAFLGNGSVPAGNYTSADITLASTLSVVAKNGTDTVTKTFKNLDASGNKVTNVTFAGGKNIADRDKLVFDFNLLRWAEDSSGIEAAVDDHPKTGLDDDSRHFSLEFRGTVSEITGTAPDQTFKLSPEHGLPFTVSTSANTALNFSNGAENPALASGQKVLVHGIYSSSSNSFEADNIRIKVQGDQAEKPRTSGRIESHTTGSTSFTLFVKEAHGFVPAKTVINVVSTATTQWFGFVGKSLTFDEFVARLDQAEVAMMEGTYDPETNTFTATRLKLDGNRSQEANNFEGIGAASSADSTAGTFSLSRFSHDGGNVDSSRSLTVTTTSNTVFVQANGNAFSSASDFWTALSTARAVSVLGKLNGQTRSVAATRVRIVGASNSEGQGVSIGGSATAIDANGDFTVQLRRWEDGHFENGMVVTVHTSSATVYRTPNGVVSQEAFLANFANGGNVKVEGRLNSDKTMNAWSIRLLPNEDNDLRPEGGDHPSTPG